MTPHNEAKKNEISKIVLMPGDPLRAKYIAETFLDNVKLVNKVRNMYSYIGEYKGKEVSVFPSGIGMPSIGLYVYELFNFYDVDKIIRLGTCGGYNKDFKKLDTLLVKDSFTFGNFAYSFSGKESHICSASQELNNIIYETSKKINIPLKECNVICSEFFDNYLNLDDFISRFPKDINISAAEMESFALFYLAKEFNKQAACLLTVVDSHYFKNQEIISSKDRESSLNNMIKIALESID